MTKRPNDHEGANARLAPVVRIAGVLIDKGRLLVVRQRVTAERGWALPGGRQEKGETIDRCIVREIKEETGLDVRAKGLLYITDRILDGAHVVHISFEVEKTPGQKLPEQWTHEDPYPSESSGSLREVRMAHIDDLPEMGFPARFRDLVKAGFPERGSYRGDFVKFYGGA